jgi:hypothetical protein
MSLVMPHPGDGRACAAVIAALIVGANSIGMLALALVPRPDQSLGIRQHLSVCCPFGGDLRVGLRLLVLKRHTEKFQLRQIMVNWRSKNALRILERTSLLPPHKFAE